MAPDTTFLFKSGDTWTCAATPCLAIAARGVVGRYGGGKTHTLAHIKHELEQGELSVEHPAECVYLELAPIAVSVARCCVNTRALAASYDAIDVCQLR